MSAFHRVCGGQGRRNVGRDDGLDQAGRGRPNQGLTYLYSWGCSPKTASEVVGSGGDCGKLSCCTATLVEGSFGLQACVARAVGIFKRN